jgi:hypothetical protein
VTNNFRPVFRGSLIRPDCPEVQIGRWSPHLGLPIVPDTGNTLQRSDSRSPGQAVPAVADALAGPGDDHVGFRYVSGFNALGISAVGIEAR